MLPALYVGIDNGASGGIAAICDDGSVFRVDPMPATDVDALAVLQAISFGGKWRTFAYLEHAQAFPKMGVSSAFNYGKGYGAMQMALVAAGIPFDIVLPRKWQAALSCLSGGDKNITKRRAQALFPGVAKITHAIADALLIAEYCRRVRTQDGKKEKDERRGGEAAGGRNRLAQAYGEGLQIGAELAAALRQTAPAGASGDGADPERAPRSAVRGDRGRARQGKRGARSGEVGDR